VLKFFDSVVFPLCFFIYLKEFNDMVMVVYTVCHARHVLKISLHELCCTRLILCHFFCRLDSSASILDLRVECQELEKISVINRFAKFHSRGQYDGAETSSSSDASANFQRLFPLKLVTAVPLPRNLPDRVQCLSL
jgi:hypothetical protein